MQNPIVHLSQVLSQLGLDPVPSGPSALSVACATFPLSARLEDDQLRLSCVLRQGVVRNRVSLWHLTHLNATPLPFGQWVMGPDDALVIGALVPTEPQVLAQLPTLVAELIWAAEAYKRQAEMDFAEVPFEAEEVAPCLLNLFRKELSLPPAQVTTAAATMGALAESLPVSMGQPLAPEATVDVLRFNAAAGLASNVTVQAESLPFVRKRSGRPDWALVLRAEVGALEGADAALYAWLNRRNYAAFGACAALRFSGRRAALELHTEMPAALAQPELLADALRRLGRAAAEVAQQLPDRYHLRRLGAVVERAPSWA